MSGGPGPGLVPHCHHAAAGSRRGARRQARGRARHRGRQPVQLQGSGRCPADFGLPAAASPTHQAAAADHARRSRRRDLRHGCASRLPGPQLRQRLRRGRDMDGSDRRRTGDCRAPVVGHARLRRRQGDYGFWIDNAIQSIMLLLGFGVGETPPLPFYINGNLNRLRLVQPLRPAAARAAADSGADEQGHADRHRSHVGTIRSTRPSRSRAAGPAATARRIRWWPAMCRPSTCTRRSSATTRDATSACARAPSSTPSAPAAAWSRRCSRTMCRTPT